MRDAAQRSKRGSRRKRRRWIATSGEGRSRLSAHKLCNDAADFGKDLATEMDQLPELRTELLNMKDSKAIVSD